MSLEKKLFVVAFFTFLLLAGSNLSYADSANQQGMLTLLKPEISVVHEPADFYFPLNFIPKTGTVPAFAVLDPANPDSILKIYDSNDSSGFLITVAMTDLTSTLGSEHIIHYPNLAIATLSQSSEGVDSEPYNEPPGSPNVTVPLFCPWDPMGTDFQSQCNSYLAPFPEPPEVSTLLLNDVSTADTSIDVQDTSQLIHPALGGNAKIIIENDIIAYDDISGNTLTGVFGINSPHSIGTTVKQYSDTSDQVSIMQNSSIADIGSYSIGFGFRLNITPDLRQDTFGGTLIFTLIAI